MKIPQEFDLPIVDILWVDSVSIGHWQETCHLDDASMYCRSVGFLVSEDEDSIAVSCSLGFGGNCNALLKIPKVSIVSFYTIEFSTK